MRILLSGGGTAGHVLPHIAVVERLKSLDPSLKILYLGSAKGPERCLVISWGWNYRSIPVGKLRRYWDWHNVTDPFKVVAGIFKAMWLVGRFRPDVHFSKGGYASLPVIVAGWIWRVPLVIHDSDAKPGLTTRLAARFARKICLGFAEAKASFSAQKVVVTGTPIRAEILKGKKAEGQKITGFNGKKSVVLVMGGSLGSKHINEVVEEALDELLKVADLVLVTGKGKNLAFSSRKRKGFVVFDYVSKELPHLYALADVVVTRAGANTIAELHALGKPCLWIPLGPPASHGDQLANARIIEKKGQGVCIQDKELTAPKLIAVVKNCLENPEKMSRMKQKIDQNFHRKAAEKVAEVMISDIHKKIKTI